MCLEDTRGMLYCTILVACDARNSCGNKHMRSQRNERKHRSIQRLHWLTWWTLLYFTILDLLLQLHGMCSPRADPYLLRAMHLVHSMEWIVNRSTFFKSSPSHCEKEVYDSLGTIVRWTPLTGSGLRIKPRHVTLCTKHYQHRGTLWHVKIQIKSIEPCNAAVRPILQLLSAPNGT